MLHWQENESLRRDHCDAVSAADMQDLHNELIGCKLREAESNMAAKQLQNEVFEIERLWQVWITRLCWGEQFIDSNIANVLHSVLRVSCAVL